VSKKKVRPTDKTTAIGIVARTFGRIIEKAMASWAAALRLSVVCVALCLPAAASAAVYFLVQSW
jgi:hypothetical protein